MMMNSRTRLFCLLLPLALLALPGHAQSAAAGLDKQIAALQAQYKQTASDNGLANTQYQQNYQDLAKIRAQHAQTLAQIASAEKTAKTAADKAALQKLRAQSASEDQQNSQIWSTRHALIAKQKTLWALHMQQIADLKKLYAEKSAAKK